MPDWQELHNEASKTIRRVMLAIVGYCFFCILSLSTPVKQLIEDGNKIKLPFANTAIGFENFLLVGPIVLIGLLTYMHVFIAYWQVIPADKVARPLPYIFNMPGRFPRFLSGFLFYWLAPLVLLIFVWKARILADAPLVITMTALVSAAMVFLAIRYRDAARRRGPRYAAMWVALLALLAVSVKFVWERAAEDGPPLVAFAVEVVDPIILAILPAEKPAVVAARPSEPTPSETVNPPSAATAPPASQAPDTTTSPRVAVPVTPVAPPQLPQEQPIAQKALSPTLDLANADLRKADLKSLNLEGADMRGANLSGRDLRFLQFKNFRDANLSLANFTGSSLDFLNFHRTLLNSASFRKTKLKSVLFQNAILKGADFTDAEFSEFVYFVKSDLRGVIGLDCASLTKMKDWETSFRDPALACGQTIPDPPSPN